MTDEVKIVLTTAYILIGLIWGWWAWEQQTKHYGFTLWRNMLCSVLNFIAWPIGILIAYIKGK